MLRSILSSIFLVLILSACGVQNSPLLNSETPTEITAESTPAIVAPQTVTPTPAVATSTPLSEKSEPTPQSPSKTTDLPTSLESDKPASWEYYKIQDFTASLKGYFGDDFLNAQMYALSYTSESGLVALAGCVSACSEVMNGSAFLLLLDEDQHTPLVSMPVEKSQKILDVDFTPDGKHLIYSVYGQILEFDLSSNVSSVIWANPNGEAASINEISPDGRYLAISVNQQVTVLDLSTGSDVAQIPGAYRPFFNQQNNRLIVLVNTEPLQVVVYDVKTWQVLRNIPIGGIDKLTVSPDGSVAAVASVEDRVIRLVDLESGAGGWTSALKFDVLSFIQFSPDGSYLFIGGFPNENADLFEVISVIDPETGAELGVLLDIDSPYFFQFSSEGESIVLFGGSMSSLQKWGRKTDDLQRVEDFLRTYFDAVAGGDYQKAATITHLDEYAVGDLTQAGLDPSDLVAAFTALCVEDEVPCLPLGRVAFVGVDNGELWDYLALVSLVQPDGEEVLFDGTSRYEFMGVSIDEQGNMKIATLHPGMIYPFD